MGRRLQRGGPRLRLDGQRLSERLYADPQPLLRSGAGPDAAAAREHRRVEPVLSGDREGPSGRLPRRVHGGGRPCSVHGPDLSAPLLEPDRLRGRADRALGRHVHARAPGERRRRLLRLEPGRQRRRMDRPHQRRGRARRPCLGDRLVQLHRPAQPHAARLQDRQGQRLRNAVARQDPRAHLSHRLQRRPAVAAAGARSGRRPGPGRRVCGTTISSGGCTPSGSWSSAARPTSCPP